MRFALKSSAVLLLSFVLLANATIAPPDKKKKEKHVKQLKVNKGQVDKSVFDRNLIQDEPYSDSILKECGTYYKNTSARLFDGPTLGFVTPVSFPSFFFCIMNEFMNLFEN